MNDNGNKPLWERIVSHLLAFMAGLTAFLPALVLFLQYLHPETPIGAKVAAVKQTVANPTPTQPCGGTADSQQPIIPAQTPPAPISDKPPLAQSKTNNIVLSVTNAVVRQGQITISFTITNNAPHRFYFLDARTDNVQMLQIDGGVNLNIPLANMKSCNGSYNECVSNPSNILPPNFDYVDAGGTATGSLSWGINAENAASVSSVSFGVMLIGKLFDGSPNDTTQPAPDPFRFSFRGIPVAR